MYTIAYIDTTSITGPQEKLLQEGNRLNIWWCDNDQIEDAKGMSKKYPDNFIIYNGRMEEAIEECDFVYVSYSHPRDVIRRVLRLCKRFDKKVINANADDFIKLEDDRHFAKKVGVDLGLDYVKTHEFTDAEEFIAFAKEADYRLVIKAKFDDRETIPIVTFIPTTVEDAINMAKGDSFNMFEMGGVVVEPFHEGYEVCIGGFFNGTTFNGVAMLNQEYKGALDGNVGEIQTGEVGTVSQFKCIAELPDRFREFMENFESYLNEFDTEYHGFIDINTIITPDGKVFLLEFTTRPGIPTELEVLNMIGNYGDFLAWQSGFNKLFEGYTYDELFVTTALFTYGYPYQIDEKYTTVNPKVEGLNNLENPYILMYSHYNDEGEVVHELYDRILIVHGRNMDLEKARAQSLSEVKKVSSWGCCYRTDIGHGWKDINNVLTGGL